MNRAFIPLLMLSAYSLVGYADMLGQLPLNLMKDAQIQKAQQQSDALVEKHWLEMLAVEGP